MTVKMGVNTRTMRRLKSAMARGDVGIECLFKILKLCDELDPIASAGSAMHEA